jgi:hypothetical protein
METNGSGKMTALGKKDEGVRGGPWPTFVLLCAALGPRLTSLAYRRSRICP